MNWRCSKTWRLQSPLPRSRSLCWGPSSAFVSLNPWTWIINAVPGVCYNRPAATHTGTGEKRAEPPHSLQIQLTIKFSGFELNYFIFNLIFDCLLWVSFSSWLVSCHLISYNVKKKYINFVWNCLQQQPYKLYRSGNHRVHPMLNVIQAA